MIRELLVILVVGVVIVLILKRNIEGLRELLGALILGAIFALIILGGFLVLFHLYLTTTY